MVDKRKIDSIRSYLLSSKRVFLNNIVVALPGNVSLIGAGGKPIQGNIPKLEVGKVVLERRFNSIGIIDGQHRVFSYHEGGKDDASVKQLRERQDLLVTGVVFPSDMTDADRVKVQAEIFLEINSKQTSASTDLIQDLSVLTSPYSEISIARQVLRQIGASGALRGKFARYGGDKGRLKTSSVVSYGVRPLVKFSGSDSLFAKWSNSKKADLVAGKAGSPVEEYVKHSSQAVAVVFSAMKETVSQPWIVSSKKAPGILSTTFVNGVLVLTRYLVANGKSLERESLVKSFKKLQGFDFSPYKSSQYGAMGRAMYKAIFGVSPP
jgi:DGQHR domain-containing protein